MVIGAHYDTERKCPGAIDNATGVAIGFSVLKKLSQLNRRNINVILVFFDQEEDDFIQVVYEDCECNLYVPNIFSPNSDNLHDRFPPLSNCGFSSYDCKIFDRWDELVFATKDLSEGWDGSFRGKAAPIGVYVYSIVYRYKNRDLMELTAGDITLTR